MSEPSADLTMRRAAPLELHWTETTAGPLTVLTAESPVGPFEFHLCTIGPGGWKLSMSKLIPGRAPKLYWQRPGLELTEAKKQAGQLAEERRHYCAWPRG